MRLLIPHLLDGCEAVGSQRAGQREDCVEVKSPRTTTHDRHVYPYMERTCQ